jgi:hypothetical protein
LGLGQAGQDRQVHRWGEGEWRQGVSTRRRYNTTDLLLAHFDDRREMDIADVIGTIRYYAGEYSSSFEQVETPR